MAGNTNPIFSKKGDVSKDGTTGMNAAVTAAAADYTGISANYALVFTADATNGGFIQRIRFKAIGTNVAAVARIFINNGSAQGTAANNSFWGEVTLPGTTASTTAATAEIDYWMNIALNPGFRVYWGLGAGVAAGWVGVGVGGVY